MLTNQRRRRNSCVALTNQGGRSSFRETTACDLEVSGSSPAVPMVVLTPESPRASPSAQVTTLFAPDCLGKNSGKGRSEQEPGSQPGGGFFIMGNSSNLTATCLDIDEEDLLNNNSNSNNKNNEAAAADVTSEDDDGSGSSSGFSLSTATLSHGELRLMQLDSAAPVATTAFTSIRDGHVAFYMLFFMFRISISQAAMKAERLLLNIHDQYCNVSLSKCNYPNPGVRREMLRSSRSRFHHVRVSVGMKLVAQYHMAS